MTAQALHAATGCSERQIKRRIADRLGPDGRVKNVRNLGYFRPDRPSPEVAKFLAERGDVTK